MIEDIKNLINRLTFLRRNKMAIPALIGAGLGLLKHMDARDQAKAQQLPAAMQTAFSPLLGGGVAKMPTQPNLIEDVADFGLMGANVGMALDNNAANNALKSSFAKSMEKGAQAAPSAAIPPTGVSSFAKPPATSQPFAASASQPAGSSIGGGQMDVYGNPINMSSAFKDPYASIPFDANAGVPNQLQLLYQPNQFQGAQMGRAVAPQQQSAFMSPYGLLPPGRDF